VRFVFDHHDLSPELCAIRFPRHRFVYHLTRLAEWMSFQVADVTLATNNTFREIALTRGAVSPEHNFVVQTLPDLNDFPLQPAQPDLKEGREHLVVYVGVMGPQDGIDLLLESISYLTHRKGRRDTLFVLIGPGSEFDRLKAQAAADGLNGCVKFTGPLFGDELRAYLATASVGVSPDPSNPFNDKLTMVKIFEYMAYGIPVVLYDLPEGHQSAGEAALYAHNNDPIDFAEKIAHLLDSESSRRQMGAIGREQIVERLNWGVERRELLKAYDTVLTARVRPRSRIKSRRDGLPSSANSGNPL